MAHKPLDASKVELFSDSSDDDACYKSNIRERRPAERAADQSKFSTLQEKQPISNKFKSPPKLSFVNKNLATSTGNDSSSNKLALKFFDKAILDKYRSNDLSEADGDERRSQLSVLPTMKSQMSQQNLRLNASLVNLAHKEGK